MHAPERKSCLPSPGAQAAEQILEDSGQPNFFQSWPRVQHKLVKGPFSFSQVQWFETSPIMKIGKVASTDIYDVLSRSDLRGSGIADSPQLVLA